jgi:hypothetical protein
LQNRQYAPDELADLLPFITALKENNQTGINQYQGTYKDDLLMFYDSIKSYKKSHGDLHDFYNQEALFNFEDSSQLTKFKIIMLITFQQKIDNHLLDVVLENYNRLRIEKRAHLNPEKRKTFALDYKQIFDLLTNHGFSIKNEKSPLYYFQIILDTNRYIDFDYMFNYAWDPEKVYMHDYAVNRMLGEIKKPLVDNCFVNRFESLSSFSYGLQQIAKNYDVYSPHHSFCKILIRIISKELINLDNDNKRLLVFTRWSLFSNKIPNEMIMEIASYFPGIKRPSNR